MSTYVLAQALLDCVGMAIPADRGPHVDRAVPPALAHDERGVGLIEYIILLGVVVLVSMVAFEQFGDAVRGKVEAHAAVIRGPRTGPVGATPSGTSTPAPFAHPGGPPLVPVGGPSDPGTAAEASGVARPGGGTQGADASGTRGSMPAEGSLVHKEGARQIEPTGPGVFEPGPGFDLEHPPGHFEGKVSTPGGAYAKVSVAASRVPALGPNDRNTVTLEITRSAAAGVTAERKLGVFQVSADAFAGSEVSYSVTMPEDHYHDVLAGRAPFPTPGDLSTLPPGSRVLMREEGLRGSGQVFGYRTLQVGGELTHAGGQAVSLHVVDGDVVRMLTGPTDAVANTTSVGLGGTFGPEERRKGASIALSGSHSLRESQVSFVDLDRAAAAAPYEQFLRTGEVPQSDAPGVLASGSVVQREYESKNGIKVSGSWRGAERTITLLEGRGVKGTLTDVAYDDGRRDVAFAAHGREVTYFFDAAFDASGTETSRQAGLLLDNLGRGRGAEYLAHAFGQHVQRGKTYRAQIELTQAEYTEIRELLLDDLHRNTPLTDTDIDLLRAGTDGGPDPPAGISMPVPTPKRSVRGAIIDHPEVDYFLTDRRLRSLGSYPIAKAFVAIRASSPHTVLPGAVRLRAIPTR